MRNRDCSRRGRGGGRDSSRDRICGGVRNRSKIGTDRVTNGDTKRGTNKARLRSRGWVWVQVLGNRDSVKRSRRRGLSRNSSSGACEGRGGYIIGETYGAAPVDAVDSVREEPRTPPGQTRLIVTFGLGNVSGRICWSTAGLGRLEAESG